MLYEIPRSSRIQDDECPNSFWDPHACPQNVGSTLLKSDAKFATVLMGRLQGETYRKKVNETNYGSEGKLMKQITAPTAAAVLGASTSI